MQTSASPFSRRAIAPGRIDCHDCDQQGETRFTTCSNEVTMPEDYRLLFLWCSRSAGGDTLADEKAGGARINSLARIIRSTTTANRSSWRRKTVFVKLLAIRSPAKITAAVCVGPSAVSLIHENVVACEAHDRGNCGDAVLPSTLAEIWTYQRRTVGELDADYGCGGALKSDRFFPDKNPAEASIGSIHQLKTSMAVGENCG